MVLNTQKLIIINLTIAVIFGLLAGVNFNDYTQISLGESIVNNTNQNMGYSALSDEQTVYGDVKTENPVQDNRPGNSIILGGLSMNWGSFLLGVIPWTNKTESGDAIESLSYLILNLFRTILIMLLTFELYLVYMNKKAT